MLFVINESYASQRRLFRCQLSILLLSTHLWHLGGHAWTSTSWLGSSKPPQEITISAYLSIYPSSIDIHWHQSKSISHSVVWLHGLWPTGFLCPWNFPDKNTRVVNHSLLQGIFLTQGSNPGLLHCRQILYHWAARIMTIIHAAAAKSLQSCLTLCDPIDGSLHPPGSTVPGIFQARILEWVAIAFSNAWKWKVKVKSLSHVLLFATPGTAAYQAPPSMGFSRQEYWRGCHCLLQESPYINIKRYIYIYN